MRLSQRDLNLIRDCAKSTVEVKYSLRLFGSRLDDNSKGGDIDLLLKVEESVPNAASLAAKLSARITRATDGMKVDVVIMAPGLMELPIHRVAMEEGVLL